MADGKVVGEINSEEIDALILKSVDNDHWMSIDRINQLVNLNAGFGEDWSIRDDSVYFRIGVLIGKDKLDEMSYQESYGYDNDYRTRYLFKAKSENP